LCFFFFANDFDTFSIGFQKTFIKNLDSLPFVKTAATVSKNLYSLPIKRFLLSSLFFKSLVMQQNGFYKPLRYSLLSSKFLELSKSFADFSSSNFQVNSFIIRINKFHKLLPSIIRKRFDSFSSINVVDFMVDHPFVKRKEKKIHFWKRSYYSFFSQRTPLFFGSRVFSPFSKEIVSEAI
jgi:hypothetical protein